MTADRQPKVPLAQIRDATLGAMETADDPLKSPHDEGAHDNDLPAVPQHPQIPTDV